MLRLLAKAPPLLCLCYVNICLKWRSADMAIALFAKIPTPHNDMNTHICLKRKRKKKAEENGQYIPNSVNCTFFLYRLNGKVTTFVIHKSAAQTPVRFYVNRRQKCCSGLRELAQYHIDNGIQYTPRESLEIVVRLTNPAQ